MDQLAYQLRIKLKLHVSSTALHEFSEMFQCIYGNNEAAERSESTRVKRQTLIVATANTSNTYDTRQRGRENYCVCDKRAGRLRDYGSRSSLQVRDEVSQGLQSRCGGKVRTLRTSKAPRLASATR